MDEDVLERKGPKSLPPVRGPYQHGYSSDELQFLYRFNLVQEPLPAWNHHIWESQRIALSSILPDEQFREVSIHYTTLERLATLRAKLTSALPQELLKHFQVVVTTDFAEIQKDATLKASLASITIDEGSSLPPKKLTYEEAMRRYVSETFELWSECEGIFNGMPSRGNTLPAKMPEPAHKPSIRAKLIARIKHRFHHQSNQQGQKSLNKAP